MAPPNRRRQHGCVALATLALACACSRERSPEDITDAAWRAHELVVTAGEGAPTCKEAGVAMQRVFDKHRAAFVDAITLDRDRARLARATEYLERHERRYRDLETRMIALSERCGDEPSVAAVFERMESP